MAAQEAAGEDRHRGGGEQQQWGRGTEGDKEGEGFPKQNKKTELKPFIFSRMILVGGATCLKWSGRPLGNGARTTPLGRDVPSI